MNNLNARSSELDGVLTADVADQVGEGVHSCDVQFRNLGGRGRFGGRIRTARCDDDNVVLKALIEEGGADVLVADGGGSLRTALLGDELAILALEHGWQGAVIFGAVRDVAALSQIGFGVKALGSNPRRSGKSGNGATDEPVSFGGVEFRTGDEVFCDHDGVIVQRGPGWLDGAEEHGSSRTSN